MSATRWAIGLAIAAVTVTQLTLLATDVASKNGPTDGRGKPGGAPASVQLTPDPIVIQCDGVEASSVTVRVTDAQGRAVPDGTVVHFDARFGFADPVEAETRRGEASTQLRLYPSARNFAGETGVDVFTDGLRASVGVDCAPSGPPCNFPFSPPVHPMSPPCEPLPCSTTDSPPVGQSPPCDPPCPFSPPASPPCSEPPCSTTDSPPIGTSPPCPAVNEIRLDSHPETEAIEAYGTFEVGETFRVSARVTQLANAPYAAYQWAIEWPTAGLAFEGNIVEAGPSLGLGLCGASPRQPAIDHPAYDDAYVGGCGSNDFRTITHMGEITEFSMSCVNPGYFKIWMIDSRLAPILQTTLFDRGGALLSTTTGGIFVECVQTTCGPFTSPPCVTPTPTPACGSAGLPPCAGQATLALDIDITNGSGPCTQIDDAASMTVGESRQVAVCLLNPDGTVPIAAFQYRVAYDDRVVVAAEVANVGDGLDDNPDANAGTTTFTTSTYPRALGGGWDCHGGVGAYPAGDRDGVPQDGDGTAYSGGCLSAPGPNTLIQGPLGVITFTALSAGNTALALFQAGLLRDDIIELGSCDPAIDVPMLCLSATIVVNGGQPQATETAAAGARNRGRRAVE